MSIPQVEDVSLILPFTSTILSDPSPLLDTIFQTVLSYPTRSFLVYFVDTPNNTQQSLYDQLKKRPRSNWKVLQTFLSKVYATVAAAQAESGKVLLDVNVGFKGTGQKWEEVLERSQKVVLLEGYEGLLPQQPNSIVIPAPSLPSSSTSNQNVSLSLDQEDEGAYPVVALGGTFDHLHAAHKLLLHLAYFLTGRKLIVGVMSDILLTNKKYAEYVEPLDQRIQGVQLFLSKLGGTTTQTHSNEEDGLVLMDVLEIHDTYGPTRDDPDIQALVISDETKSGGEAVNKLRKENRLNELDVWSIDVISAERTQEGVDTREGISTKDLKGLDEGKLKEVKMGSTGIRKWLSEHPKSVVD